MTGFGEKLRREREMRGVSLDEIAESTKIGTRNLRALEDEDFDKLPGGIFNKGFVRAYSKFLGLDEDRTVADFDSAWKEHQAAKGQAEEPQAEELASDRIPQFWLIAAALVVLVIALAGWYFLRHRSKPTTPARIQPHAAHELERTTPAQAKAPPATPRSAGQDSPSVSSNQKAGNVTPELSTSSAGQISRASNASTTTAPRTSSSAPILLEVIAHEDSWLSIFADGKSLGEEILSAQKSRTIRAQKEVRLKLGNVGGVEISFNGKPVNIDGESKQVKEFTFTAEGLRQ